MRLRIPATFLLACSALLSRLLGLVRDHMLAKTFGASTGEGIYNLDVYYAAFRIPDLLYNLLIFGAISAAFVPIFTQYKKKGELEDAWKFASNLTHLMLVFILGLALVAYLFAPQLARLVASGFSAEDYLLTVRLMRIMLLSPILFALSAILISIQDSFRLFFYRSLAPVFYNLGIIIGIYYFASAFGVLGVTWGVILGSCLQFFIQLPALRSIGYRHVWIMDYKKPDVRHAFKLFIPRLLGLSFSQLTLVLNTLMASFLSTGSITIFYFAENLQSAPFGIIAISFAITSFATLSELATEESPKAFVAHLSQISHQILFLIIPATLGMLFLRHKIIDLILVAGKFTSADAHVLASVLACMLFSLFAQSLVPLFSRGFYAYHDTKTPLWTGLFGAVVSIAGGYWLAFTQGMGIVGIAMAFSMGNLLNFFLLYALMARHLVSSILSGVKIVKMLLAGGVMTATLFFIDRSLPSTTTIFTQTLQLFSLVGAGAAAYFFTSFLLKIPELGMLKKRSLK